MVVTWASVLSSHFKHDVFFLFSRSDSIPLLLFWTSSFKHRCFLKLKCINKARYIKTANTYCSLNLQVYHINQMWSSYDSFKQFTISSYKYIKSLVQILTTLKIISILNAKKRSYFIWPAVKSPSSSTIRLNFCNLWETHIVTISSSVFHHYVHVLLRCEEPWVSAGVCSEGAA